MKKLAVLIIGGSGSGKSTLEADLAAKYPDVFKKVISATTREIRLKDNEVDGETYHYLTMEQFDEMEMVEEVTFGGNKYGVPASEFDTDKDVIMVVEPHGAEQILEYLDIPTLVIYMDINKEQRIENMKKRGDSEEMIEKRLKIDDIEERFAASGIVPNKVVKRLTPNLHLDVYEYIQIFKKNMN